MQVNENVARTVELSWAGRVRTGNKKSFNYVKDLEVICRFKEVLTREGIYKEIQKTNWPLQQILGMVLRPGGLVDFTLRSKDAALKFAKTLRELDSIKIATAHADTVVEVRIDFIPPGFPSEPITEYLMQNHGEVLNPPLEFQTDTTFKPVLEFLKWIEKIWRKIPYRVTCFLVNINLEPVMKDNTQLVDTALKVII